ncbi:MAG: hypothetical protein AAGC77_09665 [Pseudomonadota bacterium]
MLAQKKIEIFKDNMYTDKMREYFYVAAAGVLLGDLVSNEQVSSYVSSVTDGLASTIDPFLGQEALINHLIMTAIVIAGISFIAFLANLSEEGVGRFQKSDQKPGRPYALGD